jgi:magnesium transporter
MSTASDEKETIQERIGALVAAGDFNLAGALARDLHPSDVADIIESLDVQERVALVSILPAELASETLAEMEQGEHRNLLLAALTPEKGAELIEELADDDAADLMGELELDEQQKILEALPGPTAEELIELLRYDEETAGGRMTTDLVAVRGNLNAGQALTQVRLQGQEVEDFYTVFVVDARRRLLGTLRLDDLVIADPDSPITSFVEEPVTTVAPQEDQEEVGRLMARYNLAAIPVVSNDGILLGRITFDDVIDVMEAEQTEDILLMAGVSAETEALRYTWSESVRSRLPWLVVNLLTAAAASAVVYYFSETIENVVILAAVMPIVAGLGGNSGTQALAVTVRFIAIQGSGGSIRDLGAVVGRELAVGLVNGMVIGAVVATLAILVGGNPTLGLVVFLAMWGNLIVAGFLGSFVPSVVSRFGVDPAVGSSMFVTPFTDLFGFLFLLGLATRFLL